MKARDIMTMPVISVTPGTSVPEVARLLVERHISAVPVVAADGRLVGIVSEGDLMRRAEGDDRRHGSWWLRLFSDSEASATDYVKTHGRAAGDVMSRDVVTVTEDTSAAEVAHLLETKRIKRVPVLRGEAIVGIVSRADLLRGMALQRKLPAADVAASDESIRQAVLQKIDDADWAPSHPVTVMVLDGVVQIWGVIDSAPQRDALRVAAEEVPGVRGVEMHVGVVPAYAWGE